MKKPFINLFFLMFLLLGFAGCEEIKEDDTEIKDCQKNNYGVLAVKIPYQHGDHHYLCNVYEGNPMIQIAQKGIPFTDTTFTIDTLHLKPGNYKFHISSVNGAGQFTRIKSLDSSIIVCEETFIDCAK